MLYVSQNVQEANQDSGHTLYVDSWRHTWDLEAKKPFNVGQGRHTWEPTFTSSPKCRGRAQGKLKRTREARRMDKKPKRAQLSVNRAPAPSRWRALEMARPRPPFLNMEVSVGGAPAPPLS
ncbi:hypothetical protein PIB30_090520 [Stylosanthes scabra]|uniref:Uncharacterized protein n=1 Tax=Stylosanthes scabra TaxID=79078 RepID=A0ABU6ZSX3_9FABA|nr:hypothetical protein [Stylosanthes scabra]